MGSGKGGKQSTTQTSEPWRAAQPYLIGDGNTTGVFPEAMALYNRSGWTPDMETLKNNQWEDTLRRGWQPTTFTTTGANALNGLYDPNISKVAPTSAPTINMVKARAAQGELDPTSALKGLLTGNVTNPYLYQQADAIRNNLTRNTMENVMPGIRSESLASGQYGGSRQGIAEGLAASRLNSDIADSLSNMFGNAYENAQQRMYGTAMGLNSQAQQVATQNAANNMGTQQFNANLGRQNNSQEMQRANQALNTRGAGLNMIAQSNAIGDKQYQNLSSLLGQSSAYDWNNLNNYANVMMNGAKMGGSSTGTGKTSSSPLSTVMGLGLTGLGLYNGFGGAGLLGGGVGSGWVNSDLINSYGF